MNEAAENQRMTLPSDQDASGRTLGDEEVILLEQAIRRGTLTSTKGEFTRQFEQDFASRIGAAHGYACASGTAAIHTAIAAINPQPGDEIVTTAITDMGAITPILYQGAIPVFADVDPATWNITAETIEPCLSDRTRAIIVTHLFGNPCPMTEIMQLARRHGILVIEDCAQAFLATHAEHNVGTIGDVGCFSLQQGKHITTGEGGVVITNDSSLARRCRLYINKAWGYGDENPDHYFLALNYRMSELQGAVALAQLAKLDNAVTIRAQRARQLSDALSGVPGVIPPQVTPHSTHVYWKYCLRIDEAVIDGGPVAMGRLLRERGLLSAPRYIQKPAFCCEVIAKQRTFGDSRFPFHLAREEVLDYSESKYPGTFQGLREVLVLPWNERYTPEHVDFVANTVREAAAALSV